MFSSSVTKPMESATMRPDGVLEHVLAVTFEAVHADVGAEHEGVSASVELQVVGIALRLFAGDVAIDETQVPGVPP